MAWTVPVVAQDDIAAVADLVESGGGAGVYFNPGASEPLRRFGGSLRAPGGSAYREGHSFQTYSQPSQGLAPKLKHTRLLGLC